MRMRGYAMPSIFLPAVVVLTALMLSGCCACDYFITGPPTLTTPTPGPYATPGPYGTPTPAESPTASLRACPQSITECCIINAPGNYVLANDITSPRVFGDGEGVEMTGACIYVARGTRDVKLECASKKIVGPGGYNSLEGVLAVGAERVSVENCGISGFGTGIMFYESRECSAAWNVVENATGVGVFIDNSYDSNATSNLVNSSGQGIGLSGGERNMAVLNSVYHCTSGIGIMGAPAEVKGNSVSWNDVGISAWRGSIIRDNILEGNTFQAIIATSNCLVSGNRACGSYDQNIETYCKNCIYCVNAENVTGANSCNVTQICPGVTCSGGC